MAIEDIVSKDSWSAYRREVMSTLEKLGSEVDTVREEAHRQVREVFDRLESEIEKVQKEAQENLRLEKLELARKDEATAQSLSAFREKVIEDLSALKTRATLLGSIAGVIGGALVATLVEVLLKK